jgi:hypothetical protein
MNKSDAQIIAEGQQAMELLTSDFFNAMHKEYTDAILASIVQSQPHETKLREFEYAKLQAVIGFVNHLSAAATAAHNAVSVSALDDSDSE